MSTVNCPYCNHEQEVCHDDGHGYEEGKLHEEECLACEKAFGFHTHVSLYYDVSKVDCWNDADHDYQLTTTIPRCYTSMRCSMCGDKRHLTDKERTDAGIETVKEYHTRVISRREQSQ